MGRWGGPQPRAPFLVWSWDPLRFVRRQPPHHLSPAKQTTRQGVIPKGASTAPQPAQQRSDQGRKPVISEQDSCSLAWITARYAVMSQEIQDSAPSSASGPKLITSIDRSPG